MTTYEILLKNKQIAQERNPNSIYKKCSEVNSQKFQIIIRIRARSQKENSLSSLLSTRLNSFFTYDKFTTAIKAYPAILSTIKKRKEEVHKSRLYTEWAYLAPSLTGSRLLQLLQIIKLVCYQEYLAVTDVRLVRDGLLVLVKQPMAAKRKLKFLA